MISRVAFIRMKTGEELLSFEYETGAGVGVTHEKWWKIKELLDLGDDVNILVTNSPKNSLGEKLDALIREVRNIKEALEPKHGAWIPVSDEATEKIKELLSISEAAERTCDFEATAAGGEE